MKIRMGFVSNSSGSSFIVGIAVVTDRQKLEAWLEKDGIKLEKYNIEIMNADDLIADANKYGERVEVKDGNFIMNGANDPIDVKLPIAAAIQAISSRPTHEEAKRLLAGHANEVFVVKVMNDEGDSPFWDETLQEMNWNIDIDYFTGWQRKLWDGMIEENGLSNISKQFGAARNG